MNQEHFPQLQPLDEHNRRLQASVHPVDWKNPDPTRPYHLVVIGAGTAGLVTAAGAAGLGARVALIERELMGGDCLNVGCVPSKAILAAAHEVSAAGRESYFGIKAAQPTVDFSRVMERMRELRAAISPMDSARRFTELGVDVYFGHGRFLGSDSIEITSPAGNATLNFRKAVIATGARAAVPPVPGLKQIDFLTNETLFSLTDLPARLGVIGAGPIGCEMAQAFSRLGSEVWLFERANRLLPAEDIVASTTLQHAFDRDGINLRLQTESMELSPVSDEAGIRIAITRAGHLESITVDRVLVATGRSPNTDGLNLDSAGVNFDERGVQVNDFLQTDNPKIYSAGDVCSKFQYTHAADFMARIVIQNALFAIGPVGRRRLSKLVIPRATYTDPEIAHVGWTPADAETNKVRIDTWRHDFRDVDRAVLQGTTDGSVQIHTRKGTDKIVGATITGKNAGDLISEVALAMTHRIGLSKIASTIHPYPTIAEAIRKTGDQYNRTRATPFTRRLLGTLRWLNVGN